LIAVAVAARSFTFLWAYRDTLVQQDLHKEAAVRSSNPVLTHLGDVATRERGGTQVQPGQNPFQQGGYGQYPAQQYGGYPQSPVTTGGTMTIDDVVVKTILLLVLTGISGALAWAFLPETGAIAGLALFGSMIAGLVLGLVIALGRVTNPVVIAGYAIIEGVLLGVVSEWFEKVWPGIVMQAVAATFAVFFVMAALYKFRVVRATPRFTKFLLGALIAFVALSLVNFVAYLLGFDLGLVDYGTGEVGWRPILFAAAGILIGALTFILDFAQVEEGVRYGLPEKYSWYSAFGLLVGLIFLYWQILRLLSYFRR
jgi:uncharacterized YccA/Bax inhibitor family protein